MSQKAKDYSKITLRALIIGAVFAGFFAFVTAYLENRRSLYLSATQIAVLPYILMLVMVLLINPICRLIRIIPVFSSAETLIIFIMGTVSAGISTFGLTSQLGPVISSMYNEHWNSDQSGWNLHVAPFVNESFFVSEPGIQKAAMAHRVVKLEVDKERKTYETAVRERNASTALEKEISALKTLQDNKASDLDISGAKGERDAARAAHKEAAEEWHIVREEHGAATADEVVRTAQAKILKLQAETDVLREKLRVLEKKAFAKVAVFRRGLADMEWDIPSAEEETADTESAAPDNPDTEPKDKKETVLTIAKVAMPGFFYHPGDTAASYKQRYSRLRHGSNALEHLEEAAAILATTLSAQKQALSADQISKLQDLAREAVAALAPVNTYDTVHEEYVTIDGEWKAVNKQLLAVEKPLKAATDKRPLATGEEAAELDAKIATLSVEGAALEQSKKDLNIRLINARQQEAITKGIVIVSDTIIAWQAQLGDADIKVSSHRAALSHIITVFPALDASLKRYIIGDIPWGDVMPPILRWLVIIFLTYLVLMTFNVLIFRQWAHNERLIYPLAELPQLLTVADGDPSGRKIPEVFSNPLFWVGFLISGSVLGWNLFCYLDVVPGLQILDLNNAWKPIVQNTILQPLDASTKSTVFFTMIGLAFMIPSKISFSLWFFSLLYLLQVLILCWFGYGQSERSFPQEWWYTMNFRSAEGAGGMMVFAALVLYKCRKYLMCFFNPSAVSDLESGEQKELRLSSFCFLFGSAGLILVLWKGMGANLFWCIFSYFVILVITIGLVRAVTEGGILGFQAWISPFHFIRTIFGMDKAWTAPPLFAPLFIYYSVFFLDLKTFIAPAMANCIKIRDDLKMKRLRFHVAIALCIGVALVVAMSTHLILSYNKGGDAMNGWFYTGFPRSLYTQVAEMVKTTPVDTTNTRWFFAGGALSMAALLYFRQMFFWLPHPIGMIMLVNPIMNAYWFSILIGWLAKMLVTRYGNKNTYRIVRGLFIGLIVGELAIILCALIGSLIIGRPIYIDLNRN
jgi:hypothetical protein